MRDGQKFFQQGRDKVDYQLVQQQMRHAGTWRIGLRRQILAQLQSLGRNPGMFQPQSGREYRHRGPYGVSGASMYGYGGGFGGMGGGGMGGGMTMSGPAPTGQPVSGLETGSDVGIQLQRQ